MIVFILSSLILSLTSACSKSDPVKQITRQRNLYNIEVNYILPQENSDKILIEFQVTNDSDDTLPYLTVKIEEVAKNEKTIASNRVTLDVSDIPPNSSKTIQKKIKQHSDKLKGIIPTLEKNPPPAAKQKMKEYSKALNRRK